MGAGPGGTLFVVATPIGNLGDVTLRALDVLRAAPLIAAEDTRVTRRLLLRHGIETPLRSFHSRSGPARLAELVAHLRGGADLALVTDAGTPVVSDPGADLVAAWSAEGGRVEPIPGPSAVLAAVSASGLAGPRWAFEGFLPRSGRERRERLAALADDGRGAVLFEAPGRVAGTIDDLVSACGGERPIAVCRELTKRHEQVVRVPLAAAAAQLADGRIPVRGEFVLVLGWWPPAGTPGRATRRAGTDAGSGDAETAAAARAEVARLVGGGLRRSEAVRRVAASTGLVRRDLYRDTSEH